MSIPDTKSNGLQTVDFDTGEKPEKSKKLFEMGSV